MRLFVDGMRLTKKSNNSLHGDLQGPVLSWSQTECVDRTGRRIVDLCTGTGAEDGLIGRIPLIRGVAKRFAHVE
jgi:hypothetical protein